MSILHERVQSLLLIEPNPGLDYFAITIFLNEHGNPEHTLFSEWAGYTEDHPPREMRQASIVHADRMVYAWRESGESAMVVNTADDFILFFAFGGNAVVEEKIAMAIVPKWLAPNTVAHVGERGFVAISALPGSALKRATSTKHRMRIIQRDNFRCRVCGRSPNDHTDVELHVHHIRPWASGGITEDTNLITLCHTCHNGLDPHFDVALYRLQPDTSDANRSLKYWKRLQEYQAAVTIHMKECDA